MPCRMSTSATTISPRRHVRRPAGGWSILSEGSEGRSIFSLEIPDFVFGRIVDLVTKPKNHCPQQATKALIVNELRYLMKKVALQVQHLRDFG